MSDPISRRQFVRIATISVGLAGTLGGRRLWAQEPMTPQTPAASTVGGRPLYCFPLLGDIHYDKMAHHDLEWVQREKPGDMRQIEGYVRTTEQFTPRLFSGIARAVQEAEAPVPFVIQLGDLVEGLCGSYDLQALQFKDTFAAIEQAKLGVPFLMTKGNHDITGPGAPEAFDQVLLPWLSKQASKQLDSASYWIKQQEDLFVFFDGYKPDLAWLEQTLAAHPARHVFFIVHQPVVPYNARSNWTVFNHPRQAEQRSKLLDLLGKYQAIVLSGHLHKYSLLTRATEAGSFVQLAINSVVRNEVEKPRGELAGVEQFTPDLVELEPRFSADTLERRREILAAEAPAIRHFEYADVPGYAIVKIYTDRLETDLHLGLSSDTWKTRPLVAQEALPEATAGQQPG